MVQTSVGDAQTGCGFGIPPDCDLASPEAESRHDVMAGSILTTTRTSVRAGEKLSWCSSLPIPRLSRWRCIQHRDLLHRRWQSQVEAGCVEGGNELRLRHGSW